MISFTLGFKDARTGADPLVFDLKGRKGVADEEATEVSIEERAGTLEKNVCLMLNKSVEFSAELGGQAADTDDEDEGMFDGKGVTTGGGILGFGRGRIGALETASALMEACVSTGLKYRFGELGG